MSLGTVNISRKMILAATNVLDSDQHIAVNFSAVPTGAGLRGGVIARYVDSSNFVFGVIEVPTDASITVKLLTRIGGVDAQIATITVFTAGTYVANAWYNLRMKVVGTSYYLKIWASGAAQPGYWHLINTITSLQSAGKRGLYSQANAGNTNTTPLVRFDLYSSYDSNNPVTVGNSNWIQSAANTYNFPANVLANTSYYMIKTEVQDSAGMLGEDFVQVLTAWTAPTDGVSSVTTDDYGATISWTNSGIDVTFISWRVYRRYMVTASVDLDSDNTRNTWVLLYETSDVLSNYSYKDYLIPNGKATDYVVVQVADRFGSIVESPISSFSTVTSSSDRYYFIPTIPIGTIAAYQAGNVTDDSYTDEVQSETLHVIGRGRQVQVGDDLGVIGTLTIQLRGINTRVDREFLQRLASTKNLGTWMKNPYGDVRLVKFGNIQVKPLAGTGTLEMSDLTIPYTEVATDTPVTRL